MSQCIHEPLQEEVGSQGKQILWPQYGVEVNVPPGVISHGYVMLRVYVSLSATFKYPHEYTPNGPVYELIISSRGEDPSRGVTVTLSKLIARSNLCLMVASRDPSKYTLDLTPIFSFSKVEGLESSLSTGKMEVSLEASGVYLVVASTLAICPCVVILSLLFRSPNTVREHKTAQVEATPSVSCETRYALCYG